MKSELPTSALALSLLAANVRADFITGRVVDVNGNGVGGVDIDVKNLGSGGDPTLFNDGTDPNGFFTTTIPAGEYDWTRYRIELQAAPKRRVSGQASW